MSAKTILEFVNAVGLEFCAYSVSKKSAPLMGAFAAFLCGPLIVNSQLQVVTRDATHV